MKPDHDSPAMLRDHASAVAEFRRLYGPQLSFGDRLADKVAAWLDAINRSKIN